MDGIMLPGSVGASPPEAPRAVFSSTRSCAASTLTREELREELRLFAKGELRQCCDGMAAAIRSDLLKAVFQLPRSRQSVSSLHADGAKSVPTARGGSKFVGGARSSSVEFRCGEDDMVEDDLDGDVVFRHPIRSHTTAAEVEVLRHALPSFPPGRDPVSSWTKSPHVSPDRSPEQSRNGTFEDFDVVMPQVPKVALHAGLVPTELVHENGVRSMIHSEAASPPGDQPTNLQVREVSDEHRVTLTPASESSVAVRRPSVVRRPSARRPSCAPQRFNNSNARKSRMPGQELLYHTSSLLAGGRRPSVGSQSSTLSSDPSTARWFVDHPYFDYTVGALILLNALLIGVQTEVTCAQARGEPKLEVFFYLEIAFCVVFLVELMMRMFAYGRKFVTSSGRWWNCFDTVLVGLQLLELSMEAATDGTVRSGSGNFTPVRMLRVLRVIRIVRLMRVLRLIGELRTIVICIISSLRSLVWTVALMLLVMYITGVYLTQTVSDYLWEHPEAEGSVLDVYYGSLFRSILTLYQSVSGGISWDIVVTPLTLDVSPMLGILFSLYIAFVLLAIMNVVTGVFVQTAMETAQKDRDIYMVHHVREVFTKADMDGDGKVNWEEFQAQFHSKEMQDTLKLIDIDECAAGELFKLLDVDEVGSVSFDDFIDVCVRLRGPPRSIDLMTALYEQRRLARRVYRQIRHLETALKVQAAGA